MDPNNDAGLPTDGAGETASRDRRIIDAAMAAAGAITNQPGALISRMVVVTPRERE